MGHWRETAGAGYNVGDYALARIGRPSIIFHLKLIYRIPTAASNQDTLTPAPDTPRPSLNVTSMNTDLLLNDPQA